jgi:hypothetical protein
MRRVVPLLLAAPALALLVPKAASADSTSARFHAMPVERESPARVTANANLVYYGGRVISNVKVYQVSWGPNVDPTLKSALAGFYTAITGGAYFDWLGEYDTAGKNGQDGQPGSNQHIRRGTFGAAYTITPAAQGTSITDDQIQQELLAQIGAGKLPQPDVDGAGNVNAIYMIDFPPGMTITGPGGAGVSCQQFCAYHSTALVGGKGVPYGVLPDLGGPCAGGCGQNPTQVNNATSVHSHELVEAVTDAEAGLGGQNVGRPLAWYDATQGNGEIGDICNGQQAQLGSYTVQTEWSNAAGGCIATRTLALCTGNNAPCTPCSKADEGTANGCTGATPRCATDASDPKAGQCVACATSSDCSGATPTCDKSSGATGDTCRGCRANADCSGTSASATCDVASGRCVECATGADCKNPKPACNAGTCAACATNADCAGNVAGRICAPSGSCAECTIDADCKDPSNPACDDGIGKCVPHGQVGMHGPDGGAPGGYAPGYGWRPPNTNDKACATSPGGDAPFGAAAVAGLAAALGGVVRRRRARR